MSTITGNFTAPTLRNKTVALDDTTASLTYVPLWVPLDSEEPLTGYFAGNLTVVGSLALGSVFTSLDTEVATVDASGNITRVADGDARINVTLNNGIILQKTIDVSVRTLAQVYDQLNAKSLALHLKNELVTLVNGLTASSSNSYVFNATDRNPTARNASCWAASLDLTGASFNSIRGGTAITNRHVVAASHYPLSVGTVLKFMAADNTVVTREVIGIARYALNGTPSKIDNGTTAPFWLTQDWQVCTLNEALPASITPFNVYASDTYYVVPDLDFEPAVLFLDQQDRACIARWAEYNVNFLQVGITAFLDPGLAQWWKQPVSGDSGDPLFLVVNGEAALLSCHTSSGGSYPYFKNLAALYALIDAADDHAIARSSLVSRTGLRPTLYSPTGFTTYS